MNSVAATGGETSDCRHVKNMKKAEAPPARLNMACFTCALLFFSLAPLWMNFHVSPSLNGWFELHTESHSFSLKNWHAVVVCCLGLTGRINTDCEDSSEMIKVLNSLAQYLGWFYLKNKDRLR